MQTEQKKPDYVNGRWQIVLDCGTVARHVDKQVLMDFLQWNDCQHQSAEQHVRDVCRPTQKQADAVSIVVACAVVCVMLAAIAFGVSQWS